MTFNLKKILRALLFSTSEALSIRDIQAVITRYHQQAKQEPEEPEEEGGIELTPVGKAAAAATAGAGGDASDATASEQAELGEIMEQVPSLLTATQIRDAMDAIAGELLDSRAVYRLVQSPAGYRLTISPDYAEWVRLLRNEARPARLSQAAMETLAIVAYRQPVTRAEIEAIRGVSADGAISRLLDHDLVLVTGRADLPGRPIQYGTSDKFLEYTGIRSIEELPASDVLSPSQLTEWIRQATQQSDRLSDRDVGLPANSDAAPARGDQLEVDLDGDLDGDAAGTDTAAPDAEPSEPATPEFADDSETSDTDDAGDSDVFGEADAFEDAAEDES